MQAGQLKADRKATQVARAKARPDENYKRAMKRLDARIMKKVAEQLREDVKRIAATPAAIALHKAAYKLQCIEFEASKIELVPPTEETCQPQQ